MEPTKRKAKKIAKPRKPLGKKIAKTSASPLIIALHARGRTVASLADEIGVSANVLSASFRRYKVPSSALGALRALTLDKRWLERYGYSVSPKRSIARPSSGASKEPQAVSASRFVDSAREIWDAGTVADAPTVSGPRKRLGPKSHLPEGGLTKVKRAATFVRAWKDLETLAAGLRSQLSPEQMEVLGLMVAYGD